MKKLEMKLTKLEKIIAQVEAKYTAKSKSVIRAIWNNLYDLEYSLKSQIRQASLSKISKRCDARTLELVMNNID